MEKFENLKLPKARVFDQNKDKVLRALVTAETLTKLDVYSSVTGLSMQQIAGRCIEYALDHIEIVEV